MCRLISLCLGRGRPPVLGQSAAQLVQEPGRLRDDGGTVSADAQWQALYDRLHLVHGTWLDRLAQLMGLVATSCGAAIVSLHLYCPSQACFVTLTSGGPQADLVQCGDLQPLKSPAPTPSPHGPLADPATRRTLDASSLSSGTASSATDAEPLSSLQQLLLDKAPLYRHVPPPDLATKQRAPSPPLPPDWRRLHATTALTDFAVLPIMNPAGDIVAALSVVGPGPGAGGGRNPTAAASTTTGDGDGVVRLGQQLGSLARAARVLGLAFLSDAEQLASHQLACATIAALQRATSLQNLLDAAHTGLSSLLRIHLHLEGARCVLSLADIMEGRIAYFAPAQLHMTGAGTAAGAGAASGVPPHSHGPSSSVTPNANTAAAAGTAVLGTGAAPSPSSPPLAGVLGPLVDTLLLELVATGRGPGAVLPNVRSYLQQEDRPGRDVQVVLQLSHMPPACLLLAHGGDPSSSLAPEVAVYVCVPQQGLPAGLLEAARREVHAMLQLLLPIIQRQLIGPMAAEWGAMRLTPHTAGSLISQPSHSSGGTGRSKLGSGSGLAVGGGGGGGMGSEGSLASVLGSFSLGGLRFVGASDGGVSGGLTIEVDELISASPGHLKTMVAGIQSSICAAQMAQAWAAAGEGGAREALDDLYSIRLLETVGQGGQGVVFRGLMHGLEVAVKVVAKDLPGALIVKVQQQQQHAALAAIRKATAAAAAAGLPPPPVAAAAAIVPPVDHDQLLRAAKREIIRDALELAATSAVSYPHIVHVHNYFFDVLVVGYTAEDGTPRLPGPAAVAEEAGGEPDGGGAGAGGSASPSTYLRLVRRADATAEMVAEGPTNLVIVMEYCDAGTLKDVLRRGGFKRGVDAMGWPRLDLQSLYNSLLEVALALRHMHSLGLVHCDLKPSNVLLRAAPRDPRGWTCKLSDFGCVRMLRPPAEDGSGPRFPHFTVTRALGTLTHMAPEVISKGALLTSSVDIYSFGIMMAELLVGNSQDSCLHGKEAISLARKGVRPPLPPYCPKEYRDVTAACWSHDPHARPSAAQLVNVLQALLNQLQGDYSSGGFPGDSIHSLMHLVPSSPPPAALQPQHPSAAGTSATQIASTARACPTAQPRQQPPQTPLQPHAHHQQQRDHQFQQQQQQLGQQAELGAPQVLADHNQPSQMHSQQQQSPPHGAVLGPIPVPSPAAAAAGPSRQSSQPAPSAGFWGPGSTPCLTPCGLSGAGSGQHGAVAATVASQPPAGTSPWLPPPPEAASASDGAAGDGGGAAAAADAVPAAGHGDVGDASIPARTCTAVAACNGSRRFLLEERHWDRGYSTGGAGEGSALDGGMVAGPACGISGDARDANHAPSGAAAGDIANHNSPPTPAVPQRRSLVEPQVQAQGPAQRPSQQYGGMTMSAVGAALGDSPSEPKPSDTTSPASVGSVFSAASAFPHSPSSISGSALLPQPPSLPPPAPTPSASLLQPAYAGREQPAGSCGTATSSNSDATAPVTAIDVTDAAAMAKVPLNVVLANESATFGELVPGASPAGGRLLLEGMPRGTVGATAAGDRNDGDEAAANSVRGGGGGCIGQFSGDSESGAYNSACSTSSVRKGA